MAALLRVGQKSRRQLEPDPIRLGCVGEPIVAKS